MKTFFIAGVQRSGTTLLSVLLSNHPDILMERRSIAFRIVSCFKHGVDLLAHNVDVDEKDFLEWLIRQDQNGRLAELIDEEQIEKGSTVRELIDHSIRKKLQESGKVIWGDKSPNIEYFIPDLLMLMPDTRIIHIIRDGRANANSMSRRASRHLLWSAQQWVDGNLKGLMNEQVLGSDSYQLVRYEDLMRNPEKELRAICDFLEIPFSADMLSLADGDLEDGNRYVKNYFDQSKIDQWKTQLSESAIKKVEKIQGPLLKRLGYELITPPNEQKHRPLSLLRRIYYNQLDNVKTLFRSERVGMKNREQVLIRMSFKSRLYNFLRVFVQDFVSLPLFKKLFPRVFYRQKYFTKKDKKAEDKVSV